MLAALPLPNLCNAASGTADGNPWNGIAAGGPGSNLISPGNCPSWITSQATGLATGNIDAQGGPGTTNNNTRNYYWINNGSISRRNDIVRLDFNLTSKLAAFVRFGHDHFLDNSAAAIPLKDVKTGQFLPTNTPHPNPGRGWAVGATYTISPTMINQLTLGYSWNDYAYDLNAAQLDRGNMLNPPSFHNYAKDPSTTSPPVSRPESSAGQLYYQAGFPTANFGGGQLVPRLASGQPFCNGTCPNYNFNPMYSVADSVSKTIRTHNFKAGIYYEWNQKVETSGGNSQGTYNFSGADDPFFQANTWMASPTPTSATLKPIPKAKEYVGYKSSKSLEAFVQDNWRVTRRLTLDLGVRFSHLPAMQDISENMTMFVPSTYNAALAERIFYPYCSVSTATAPCPTGDQYSWDKAMNPNAVIGTGLGGPGNMYPSYLAAGTLVPAVFNGIATGGYSTAPNPYTGMQTSLRTIPTFRSRTGSIRFRLSPRRSGSASPGTYSETEKPPSAAALGKTCAGSRTRLLNARWAARRIRYRSPNTMAILPVSPPTRLRATSQDNLPPANQIVGLSPLGTTTLTGQQRYESTYNGSFEIQQNLGFSSVVQVAYVMVLDRHSMVSDTINNRDIAAGFRRVMAALYNQLQPAALDPTRAYLDQYLPGGNAQAVT